VFCSYQVLETDGRGFRLLRKPFSRCDPRRPGFATTDLLVLLAQRPCGIARGPLQEQKLVGRRC
jgi:hypothetical protein